MSSARRGHRGRHARSICGHLGGLAPQSAADLLAGVPAGALPRRRAPPGADRRRRLRRLRREPDGHCYLVTPAEKMRIAVEDAPFLVVLPDVCGSGRDQQLAFITNVGDETIADSENRIRVNLRANEEPAPYVHMRRGLEPCISRNVFYQLAQLAVAGEDASVGGLGVWSSGVFFPLGSVA